MNKFSLPTDPLAVLLCSLELLRQKQSKPVAVEEEEAEQRSHRQSRCRSANSEGEVGANHRVNEGAEKRSDRQ